MIVDDHTTAVDIAFSLSGSLVGFPSVIEQLPAGLRIGFDTLPEPGDDVTALGQTWTPTLAGVEVDVSLNVENDLAVQKAPFTTNLYEVNPAYLWGRDMMRFFFEHLIEDVE